MESDADDSTMGPSTASATQQAFQQEINAKVLADLVARMSRCHSLPELLRTIPAPAQERTKNVLEKVLEAFIRLGSCEFTQNNWKDALEKAEYERISELNSLKAPSVQLSKLAKEVDERALNAITFDLAITNAKNAMLQQMITLKEQEISNLKSLCSERRIKSQVYGIWHEVSKEKGITAEHLSILDHRGCAERLVQMAISIGHNSLARSANNKKTKQDKKEEADKAKTDIPTNDKSFSAMFHEHMKRQRQSEKDKKINSKKGSGRAGPPKTPKNPGNRASKVQKPTKKKGPTGNAKKVGTSTKRRQGRR